MVMAPRGAGKSAQRKMVETLAPEDLVLCVTYDTFRKPGGKKLTEMALEDHLANIARMTAMGLLTWMGSHPGSAQKLSPGEKDALRALTQALLTQISAAEQRETLYSLRNLSDTAKEIWNEHHWVIDAVLSAINILGGGMGGGSLPSATSSSAGAVEPDAAIDLLGRLAVTLELKAIYVLIDRVDETAETSADPMAAYAMIAALMHELKVLEHRPFAYKFFLPDDLLPFYQRDGGRSDRIRNYETRWRNDELDTLMARRLSAYSGGRVSSLRDLLAAGSDAEGLVRLSIHFAQRSPRDLIRIWGRAVAEQLRINHTSGAISETALLSGIDAFSREKADEIATADTVRDLKRVARVDFTVSEVASDVFHVDNNSARARIQSWENRGVVKKIGEVPVARGRPHHHYGVVDIRVARSIFPDVRLDDFLTAKARLCPGCESPMLRDWDDARGERDETCIECGIPVQPIA